MNASLPQGRGTGPTRIAPSTDQRLDEARLSSLGAIRNILRRATLTVDAVLQIIADLRELGANTDAELRRVREFKRGRGRNPITRPQPSAHDCTREMSARNGQNDRQIESIKKELIKKDAQAKQTSADQNIAGPSMNRDPAKMSWTDFTHVSDFFPDPPRTGEALNRVLFDIGRLLRIRQEKLMRGLQKAGAGRLLVILDYLLGRGETIRQPEAYFETILGA